MHAETRLVSARGSTSFDLNAGLYASKGSVHLRLSSVQEIAGDRVRSGAPWLLSRAGHAGEGARDCGQPLRADGVTAR